MTNEKKQLGQYFTIYNPFKYSLFKEWAKCINEEHTLLEPFAGANNIVKLMIDVGFNNKWKCYDIDTSQTNVVQDFPVEYRDTIKDFPIGYDVCITNPPYLSKVSASRMKLDYPKDTEYVDLYMLCLEKMLLNCKYVAAIIPESYITQNLFLDRLYGVISINMKMFEDTDCPVCLALFSPKDECSSPKIYVGDEYVGTMDELSKFKIDEYFNYYNGWKINDKNGSIGVKCVDSVNEDDISFFKGELIPQENIKVSSRSATRVSGIPEGIDIDKFIEVCNELLLGYRKNTKDVFLTSFKGLSKKKKYRRRLDFKTLKCIMNQALSKF